MTLVLRPAFWAWLPVFALPPVMVLDAALNDDGKAVTAAGVLAAVVACVPLAWRSRMSFAVMAPIVTGAVVLVLWQLEPGDTVVLIPAVALAEIATRSDRRHVLWFGVVVVPCVIGSVAPFADTGAELFSISLRNLAYCWLALAAGDAVRSRREAIERESERRAGEERLRIARDVHDVVAHAMVAINVQAGVAAHLIDRDPEQARSALRDIKASSGEALADLRATLGVLREDTPVAPTGDRLDDLAAGLRAAGVRVTIEAEPVEGEARAAVRRIVQEALTNVLRHARASEVRVRVAREGDLVALEVVDDGEGTGGTGGAGQGLRGMRERAAALGGTVESGPADGGGWRVSARIPA
jgi:signal transduction histidine kinase